MTSQRRAARSALLARAAALDARADELYSAAGRSLDSGHMSEDDPGFELLTIRPDVIRLIADEFRTLAGELHRHGTRGGI